MDRLGVKLLYEFSKINPRLFHADAYLTASARARAASEGLNASDVILDASKYTELEQSLGAMTVLIVAGDELQFPCVPQADYWRLSLPLATKKRRQLNCFPV